MSNHEEKEKAETGLLSALTSLALSWARKLDAETAAIQGMAPKSLAADVPAKTPKAKKEPAAPAAPAPTPAPAAPAAPGAQHAPAVNGVAKEQDEASKKLALDTASAYVRHFSKSVPDGMVRARTVLGDKFGGKKIAELVHAERLQFVEVLKSQMAPAGTAA